MGKMSLGKLPTTAIESFFIQTETAPTVIVCTQTQSLSLRPFSSVPLAITFAQQLWETIESHQNAEEKPSSG